MSQSEAGHETESIVGGGGASRSGIPQGPRLKMVLLVLGVALVMLWVGTRWGDSISGTLDRMLASLRGEGDRDGGDSSEDYFTCGMHPWVILLGEGDCPICHMALTPLDPEKFTGKVAIDPIVTQNMGVRIEPVTTGPLVRTIRTVGTVTYDETTVRDVNSKVAGWLETVHVSSTGSKVTRGEPLFDLYSPELYSAQEVYLQALRGRDGPAAEFLPRSGRDAKDHLRSARTRLEFYDIGAEEIQALEKRGEPSKALTLKSPHTGVVIDRHANEGMRVEPGMRLYRIADLSRVWVLVTLYEFQLPYVTPGQQALMTLPYIPGQKFEGKVAYVYPTIDEKTRELSIRLEFDNPGTLLKPGMFANIELRSVLAEDRTLAPRAAVLDTGERQVAFASLGEGRFEPREVRLGIEAEKGMVEILDGLKPGEMVVTSGQFLLDSESKVREALAKMVRGTPASEQKASAEVTGASELSALPEAAVKEIQTALKGYFELGGRLSRDTAEGLVEPARELAGAVDRLVKVELPDDAHFWHRHTEAATVRGKALELIEEKDLAQARSRFADLSFAFSKLLRATGIPPSYGKEVQELHCPMYREGQGGGFWLQPEGDVRNPFFGSSMLRCYDKRKALPVTGGAAGVEP